MASLLWREVRSCPRGLADRLFGGENEGIADDQAVEIARLIQTTTGRPPDGDRPVE